MEFWQHIVLFFVEALTIFAIIAGIILLIAANTLRGQERKNLSIERWDLRARELGHALKNQLMSDQEHKAYQKSEKNLLKLNKKNGEKIAAYVIDFKGDIKAQAVENFREEVTAVLNAAKHGDEVLVKIESPGGMVHTYGLAASQLLRLKAAGLRLTVSVDKVAASGGYLMACTADQIIAAPFAIVGSIGVVAQVPNLYHLLKKHDVSYKEYTAGDYKRTVSMLGEITEKGEKKFIEQLEDTHALFKEFVYQSRPKLDVASVATGEYWYGARALDLGLVDKIQTSDDWLLEKAKHGAILTLKYEKKQSLNDRLSGVLGKAIHQGVEQTISDLEQQRLPQ